MGETPIRERTEAAAAPTVPSRGGRRGRAVPLVFGGTSALLVAGVVAVALVAPPPSTPPLAAVAPAPQEQVDVERVEQSSRFGEGGGAGEGECVAGEEGCEGAGAQPDQRTTQHGEVVETTAPGGLRNCATGPGGPRQTDDPQSPPCVVEIFAGDNGGATTRGVTATEIKVAVLARRENKDSTSLEPFYAALESHFNRHYEFWGRSLVLELIDAEGAVSKPEDARAFASDVLAREPFASLEYPWSRRPEYVRAITDAGVIATLGEDSHPVPPSAAGVLSHPLVWSVYPQFDGSLRALGDLACTRLAGRPARHAGDPELQEATRRFGVLVMTNEHRYRPDAFTERLDACGVEHVAHEVNDEDRASKEGALTRMREAGVTTLVCACPQLDTDLTEFAEAIGWHPEWLMHSTRGAGDGANAFYTSSHPPAQLATQFGLHAGLRAPGRETGYERQRFEEQYWYRAVIDENPEYTYERFDTADELYGHYAQLLILASGIQAAGPQLTAESFVAGLEEQAFPNPFVGRAPWYQPSVGFGPADHTFNSDYSLFWFRPSDVRSDTGAVQARNKGRFCYVDDGARFTPGHWPEDADDMFFDPEAGCR